MLLYEDLEYENVLMCATKGRKGQTVSAGFSGSGMKYGVRTTQVVKKLGCSVLKSLIEEDKLIIEDLETVNELTTFVAKKQSFEADDGHNDDLVMTLVLFSWLTRQDYFRSLTDMDIRKEIYEDKIDELEDEMTPYGIFHDDIEDEDQFWDGQDRWGVAYPE